MTLWARFSKGDTFLDYCFHLFKGNDVVLKLVSPDIGSAGVERDEPTPPGQGTRAMATSRGKRRRLDDDSAMASLDAILLPLRKPPLSKRALVNWPPGQRRSRTRMQQKADPRFAAHVESQLKRKLCPAGEAAASAALPGPDGSSAASLDGRIGGLPAGEGVVEDDESDLFM